jgi:hypothetical protein
MTLLKIQLNHPGKEKPFKIGKGYQTNGDNIIREWNDEDTHYRKFIANDGDYLDSLESTPKIGNLIFWGEWEGNSLFEPINNGEKSPNGIHKLFHSILIRGCENTDPYIYGDFFKYAICSQTGGLTNLSPDSLILFGTTTNNGFELDTVFVVKTNESAKSVYSNKGKNYSVVYHEETLEQLEETYLGPNHSMINRLYHGQTWWENKEYFSFVPCKINNKEPFHKVKLPVPPMAKQKVGHPYHHLNRFDHIELWQFVVDEVIKQGFYLGIRFTEPVQNDKLLSGINYKLPRQKSNCITDIQKNEYRKSCY